MIVHIAFRSFIRRAYVPVLAGAAISCTGLEEPTRAVESESPVQALGTTAKAATTIEWSGYTWNVTTGSMAGGNTGSADNVFVDAAGRLHLRIEKRGKTWTCAELFTTELLGFGTYQWHVEGSVDDLDRNIVLGLFAYGPIAGIGTDGRNEIDIEYAKWGSRDAPAGNWTVWPEAGSQVQTTPYEFSLTGTYTTSRFTWSSSEVTFSILGGFQPIDSDVNAIVPPWTYAPDNPTRDIPQRAMPFGINFWLFQGRAPKGGKSFEVIIHGFSKA